MAVGKVKKGAKAKKGAKKKSADAFAKKEWYDLRVPAMFPKRYAGKTVVNRSQGVKLASDALRGRVFEVNQQDLCDQSSIGFRKFRFIIEDVQGKDCLTNFYGMSITTDRLWSLVKKGQTTIEAFVDIKTRDGYILRFFSITFIKRRENQLKRNSYAKASQTKAIRRIMNEFVIEKFSSGTIKDVMRELTQDTYAKDVEERCAPIKNIKDFTIRKVKLLKSPKIDMVKLRDIHTEQAAPTTANVRNISGRSELKFKNDI